MTQIDSFVNIENNTDDRLLLNPIVLEIPNAHCHNSSQYYIKLIQKISDPLIYHKVVELADMNFFNEWFNIKRSLGCYRIIVDKKHTFDVRIDEVDSQHVQIIRGCVKLDIQELTLSDKEIIIQRIFGENWEVVSFDSEELLNRIQGNSENSSATTDPFVNLGVLKNIKDLISYPEKIIENNGNEVDMALITSGIQGVYRAQIGARLFEMKLYVNVLGGSLFQTITGLLNIINEELVIDTTNIITVERNFTNKDGWGDWEVQLVSRLQGTSKDTNPQLDPFKRIEVKSISGLFDYFNNIITNNGSVIDVGLLKDGGMYRTTIDTSIYEIKFMLDISSNTAVLVIQGLLGLDNGECVKKLSYNIIERVYTNGSWGDWKLLLKNEN